MKTHDCKIIRRQIDEANLDASLTLEASEHLSTCEECRRFNRDRRTLRGLMADLQTVGAPADFDFRLRARLARDQPSKGFGSLLLGARPVAGVALIVLIAMAAFVVKSRWHSIVRAPELNATNSQDGHRAASINTSTGQVPVGIGRSQPEIAKVIVAPVKRVGIAQRHGNDRGTAQNTSNSLSTNGRALRVRDSAATAADVVTRESLGALVLVPIESRSFKLKIDNGRGQAHTISLPPVSFGSQRLLTREATYLPVSSSRGDW